MEVLRERGGGRREGERKGERGGGGGGGEKRGKEERERERRREKKEEKKVKLTIPDMHMLHNMPPLKTMSAKQFGCTYLHPECPPEL